MTGSVVDYIQQFSASDMPAPAREMAKRCLLDLIGVAAAGTTTELSRITRRHAVRFYPTSTTGARLLFDGRTVNPLGAALANATGIDAIDAHDGHPLTKGHAGCGLLPGLLAILQAEQLEISGEEFLGLITLGYEVAIRSGLALHGTVPDYHTSGAWVAVAVAGLAGRMMGLDPATTAHAMGIAEYHGPRSQMMRCIEFPTMLKDGSGWGAFVGVSSAYLAADGYTGAPAITVDDGKVSKYWADLGERWMITEQYFKPFPVCRWAQPAMEAVSQLKATHDLRAEDIEAIDITTFTEAAALATYAPKDTEQAQYSLPFPVAAYFLRGQLGPNEVGPAGFTDPQILAFAQRIKLHVSDAYDARFPKDRIADAKVTLKDGRHVQIGETIAPGNMDNPLSDQEIAAKFELLMDASGLADRSSAIIDMVETLEEQRSLSALMDAISRAPSG